MFQHKHRGVKHEAVRRLHGIRKLQHLLRPHIRLYKGILLGYGHVSTCRVVINEIDVATSLRKDGFSTTAPSGIVESVLPFIRLQDEFWLERELS